MTPTRPSFIFAICLCWLCMLGCGPATPSVSLAPSQAIIQHAIALQVQQTQERLGAQLAAAVPDIKISQVKLKTLEGLYVGHLPTYHLHGRYTLELTLPNQAVKQSANDFDLYLQRQAEGKTWRWLQPADPDDAAHPHRWLTYQIGSTRTKP